MPTQTLRAARPKTIAAKPKPKRGTQHTELPRYGTITSMIEQRQPRWPVYCVYPRRITKAAQRFLKGFPGTTLYAVKANPSVEVLDRLYAAGVRYFDTASLAEVQLIGNRYPDAECHFMSPIRIRGSAGEAYKKYGVRHFVIDDLRELKAVLEESGVKTADERKQITIFVRLSTPVEGAMLELNSKFGVHVEEGVTLLKEVAASGCTPALTFHVGTLCIKPEAYSEAMEICQRVIVESGVEIGALDVGGGFPAPYPGLAVPTMETYFEAIKSARVRLNLPRRAELYCEPGRALVAEGLSVVTQVVMRRGERLYLNDGVYGSLDEMTLPDWNIEYPRRVYMRTAQGKVVEMGGPRRAFRVFGPTCDTLDKLPKPILLPQNINDGDWIEFGLIGAYSTALRTSFNGFYPNEFVEVNAA